MTFLRGCLLCLLRQGISLGPRAKLPLLADLLDSFFLFRHTAVQLAFSIGTTNPVHGNTLLTELHPHPYVVSLKSICIVQASLETSCAVDVDLELGIFPTLSSSAGIGSVHYQTRLIFPFIN